MTLEAGTSIGKYIVKRKLAEGGMAEIYLAASQGPEGFEKEVVIKRVRSFLSDDEGFVRMFIAEARLASRLNHANVVQIFDFDRHEDSYYLAMEYVRGCSLWDLRKRCREKGVSMPPVLVAHIGAQVAAGLNYAHRAKSPEGEPLYLVHRDVTPHNVLLSLDGAVKLTDFGIAKAGNKLTQPGVLKGKFAYMSPEQARGEEVDARTDIFALGVVLWEMLTGGKLFDGDSEMAVLRAVQESVIASPARLNPEVPEDLDAVIATALEREPEARFQSAGEMERALAQCVLSHATSVDETDVGTFVRRILDAPLTQFIPTPPALLERSRSRSGSMPATNTRSRTGESPATAAPSEPTMAPPREPTAVMARPGSVSPGRPTPVVREAPPEESLVSASTLVLPRNGERGGQGAASEPRSERTSQSVAPVRVAQVLPAVSSEPASTPAPAPAPTKRGGKGLWVGVGVVGLGLIGGVVALVGSKSSEAPAPTAVAAAPSPAPTVSAQTPSAPTPAPASPATAPAEVKAEPAAVVDAGTPAPSEPDAGTTPAAQPPATQTAASSTPAPAAPAAEARGTLIVRATPYATVTISGQKPVEVQGSRRFSLPPGKYKVTFQHPSGSESHDVTLTPNGTVTQSFSARRK